MGQPETIVFTKFPIVFLILQVASVNIVSRFFM